jgi:hypothetical protein
MHILMNPTERPGTICIVASSILHSRSPGLMAVACRIFVGAYSITKTQQLKCARAPFTRP